MANTSNRTLRLLSLLQNHRYWPGPELADRLEISVRTLRRDIDRLRELGYPVDATRGADGGYQLAAGASLPPLVLDDDEAVALVVGLQLAARGGAGGALAEPSVRALAKAVQVMPPKLRRRVDVLQAMTVPASWESAGADVVDPNVLTTAALACRDTERLELVYTSAAGVRSERLVNPHRLVLLGRRWYLVAYDNERHDWRTFRVDRVESARATGATFAPRRLPDDDAEAFVRNGLGRATATHGIVVDIEASADHVRAHVGRWGTVEALGDDRCRLHMASDSFDWPAMALGSLDADFTVVAPPELSTELRRWATRFGRAARSPRP